MSDQRFFDLFLAGSVKADAIDDYVAIWHQRTGPDTLAEFLGLTDAEYAQWVSDPSALEAIKSSRQERQRAKTSSRLVRVAICQLESHPALYVGNQAFLEEPFVPESPQRSLAYFGTHGLDLGKTQRRCHDRYLSWQRTRLVEVLAFLTRHSPDLVLFPEGAIPLETMEEVAHWSAGSGAIIAAGTHTPRFSPGAKKIYERLGVPKDVFKRLSKYGSINVMPLIRSGKTALVAKRLHSPFEKTEMSASDPVIPALRVETIEARSGKLDVLPLICSEALQKHNVHGDYALAAICAYDRKPVQFAAYIEQEIRNRHFVAFCNDGAAGGSRLAATQDDRSPSWFHDRFPDGLPAGDAVLVADLDLDARAVEVGTARPASAFRLVALAAVVAAETPSGASAKTIMDARTIDDVSVRAARVEELLAAKRVNPLQAAKADHLATLDRRGVASDAQWDVLAEDIVVSGSDLATLEAELAVEVREELEKLMSAPMLQLQSDLAAAFLGYLSQCRRRAKSVAPDSPKMEYQESAPATEVLDREAEIRSVHSFLDSSVLTVAEVLGLPQIGKSSLIRKALAQSGMTRVARIALKETSSPDYFVASLLRGIGGNATPPFPDLIGTVNSQVVANLFDAGGVLIIEGADQLHQRGAWREEIWPELLEAVIAVASQHRGKIIIESRRELPLDLADPSRRKPLRVHGLDRGLIDFGVSLFDAQLRRVDLNPGAIAPASKKEIVKKLGGHPVAIALAADAAFAEGADAVLGALKNRKGFFLNFLGKLVRTLGLSDDERQILALMCLARASVPREVLAESASFSIGDAVRSLISLGAVEARPDGSLEIASVLREHFDSAQLPPTLVKTFHEKAERIFSLRAERDARDLDSAIEAEFHGALAGVTSKVVSNLVDGFSGSVEVLYRDQKYAEASKILEKLLRTRRSTNLLRLAALVEAHLNRFPVALDYAREVFKKNPRDAALLTELTKISLTQYTSDDYADELLAIGERAGIEDDNLLTVEGRLWLRRGDLDRAEDVLERAVQLTDRNPWPFFFLGKVHLRAGRVDEAVNVLVEGENFFYEKECRNRSALNAIHGELAQAYLYLDRVDLAEPIINALVDDDPDRPEIARAFAALSLKRDGVQAAHKAYERLARAEIKSRADRCQFHLFYGQFLLGIGDKQHATEEFRKAHAADRSNVYVMMRWAKTLYEIAISRSAEADESYKVYASDCASLVRKILEFDEDNKEGIELMHSLYSRFGQKV